MTRMLRDYKRLSFYKLNNRSSSDITSYKMAQTSNKHAKRFTQLIHAITKYFWTYDCSFSTANPP